jgi:hypothetical protein
MQFTVTIKVSEDEILKREVIIPDINFKNITAREKYEMIRNAQKEEGDEIINDYLKDNLKTMLGDSEKGCVI